MRRAVETNNSNNCEELLKQMSCKETLIECHLFHFLCTVRHCSQCGNVHSVTMCTVQQCPQCDIIHSAGMPTVRQCAQYVLLALHIAAMQNHSQTGICSDAQKSRQKVALAKRCYFCKMLNFLLAKGEEEFYQLLFRTLHLKGK